MNKIEFLTQLENRLKPIPKSEVASVLAYYNEYFDDAGEQNEQTVITELGAPSKIATQIISNFAIKEMEEKPLSIKKSFSAIKYVLLGVVALPAIPLAITAIAIMISILIVVFSIVVSLFATVLAIGISGIAITLLSIALFFMHFPTGFLFLGAGLLLLGIALMLWIPVKLISVKSFRALAFLFNRFLKKRSV